MTLSLKRLRANRRNAKKSTGPRTAAGKRRSSVNSLKHGVYATHSIEFLKSSRRPEDTILYVRLKKSLAKAHTREVPKKKKDGRKCRPGRALRCVASRPEWQNHQVGKRAFVADSESLYRGGTRSKHKK